MSIWNIDFYDDDDEDWKYDIDDLPIASSQVMIFQSHIIRGKQSSSYHATKADELPRLAELRNSAVRPPDNKDNNRFAS